MNRSSTGWTADGPPSPSTRALPRRGVGLSTHGGLRHLGALALLIAGYTLGCTGGAQPPPEPPPRYEDLVTDGSLARANGTSTTGELFCADETRFGVTLEAGAEVRLSATLGGEPRLLLSACAEADDTPPGEPESEPSDASLTVTVEGDRGLSSEMRLDLSAGRWVERSLPLAAHAGGQVGLRLSTGSRPVHVADLAVRHRLPTGTTSSPTRGRADGGWSWPWSRDRRPPPRILLISIDTLRRDAVGDLAGPSDRPSPTPSLDAFATQAEVWTSHYAAASWTKPSHASMLTGVSPAVHGALGIEDPMTPEVETLAERFSAAGLATAALVYDCRWLAPDFGFAQGFDTYAVVPWRASQAVRGTASWVAEHPDEGFFYFLHLFTPHSDSRVLPYEGEGVTRRSVERLFGVADYGCRAGRCASALLTAINDGLEPLPEEGEILRHLYRGGVSDVDRALGKLFEDLRDAGLWDAMTVVVTSDHGEAFFEHGRVLHGTLHQEILQVPLLVKWPGGEGAGTRREVPSSALDLAPTLLASAGLPIDGLPGTPLERRPRGEPIFAGTLDRALIEDGWKLVVRLRGGQMELYDLSEDPAERHDLSADPRAADRLERLRRHYEAFVERERELRAAIGAHAHGDIGPTLTPEERERLEALGYLQ